MSQGSSKRMVLVGKIVGAHGLRGQVKVHSYTANPRDIANYGTLYDQAGKLTYKLKIMGDSKDGLLANVRGITERNQAEILRGTELYIPRGALPDTAEDEFYIEDLIGLRVQLEDGTLFGTIKAMLNYGAGDLAEIKLPDQPKTELFLFNHATFPVIDLKEGILVIHPPEIIETDEKPPAQSKTAANPNSKRDKITGIPGLRRTHKSEK